MRHLPGTTQKLYEKTLPIAAKLRRADESGTWLAVAALPSCYPTCQTNLTEWYVSWYQQFGLPALV